MNLPMLATVTGSLSITEQQATEAITLPELVSVGQDGAGDSLKLDTLSRLALVSAPKLGSVPGNIAMNRCGQARDPVQSPLTLAFTTLRSIGGSFDLNELPSLKKLDGIPLLASVGGALRMTSLSVLSAFESSLLQTVGGRIAIDRNDALTNVTLTGLSSASGISITQAPALTAILLLPLATLGNDQGYSLYCQSLPVLATVSAPNLVTSTGAIYIDMVGAELGPANETLLSFGALKTVGGLHVERTSRVVSLAGFSALTTINGYFYVATNSALTSLTMPSLTTVTDSLRVWSNEALSTVALPSFTSAGTGFSGSLGFDYLPALTSISVPKIERMPSTLFIFYVGDSPAISSPLALDFGSLVQVGESLEINDAPHLRDLSGFARVVAVGGTLMFDRDRELASAVLPQLASRRSAADRSERGARERVLSCARERRW